MIISVHAIEVNTDVVHIYVKALAKIASRYAPSRVLSFDSVRLFKTLQLMEEKEHISRSLLCKELSLGEGVVRTLLKHLKMQGLIKSTNSGTRLTEKGMTILSGLVSSILQKQVYQNPQLL